MVGSDLMFTLANLDFRRPGNMFPFIRMAAWAWSLLFMLPEARTVQELEFHPRKFGTVHCRLAITSSRWQVLHKPPLVILTIPPVSPPEPLSLQQGADASFFLGGQRSKHLYFESRAGAISMCAGVKTSIVYGHQTLQVGVYYVPIFFGLDHQTFQVTKMEVLTTHLHKLYVRSMSGKTHPENSRL